MTHLAVREFERLYQGREGERTGDRRGERRLLSRKHFRRLRAFDEKQAGSEGELIFEWRRDKVWPKQWVGVVQVGGLTVEVLPKIEGRDGERRTDFARRNLLYMLAMAGEVPLRPRDVANVAAGAASLLDIFVDIFARRLLDELGRGRHQSYEQKRENLNVLRGKLQFSQHLKQNAARRDRFFVEYDEYVEDNLLNRIFKAACRRLRGAIQRPSTDEKLKNAVMLLADVADVGVEPPDFDRVHFTRRNRRFRECFEFCRLLYLGQSPTASFGQARTYSVLFDMNSLYESFITEFVRHHVLVGELGEKLRLYPQSKRIKRYLLWTGPSEKKGPVRMRPDLLLVRRDVSTESGNRPRAEVIIDTKWKQLEEATSGRTKGVSSSDLYQLYAYTHRYQSKSSVLLYPQTAEGLQGERFVVPETVGLPERSPGEVAVEFVLLDRDLAGDRDARDALAEELRELIEVGVPGNGAEAGVKRDL